jgi:hypothetical protein
MHQRFVLSRALPGRVFGPVGVLTSVLRAVAELDDPVELVGGAPWCRTSAATSGQRYRGPQWADAKSQSQAHARSVLEQPGRTWVARQNVSVLSRVVPPFLRLGKVHYR